MQVANQAIATLVVVGVGQYRVPDGEAKKRGCLSNPLRQLEITSASKYGESVVNVEAVVALLDNVESIYTARCRGIVAVVSVAVLEAQVL